LDRQTSTNRKWLATPAPEQLRSARGTDRQLPIATAINAVTTATGRSGATISGSDLVVNSNGVTGLTSSSASRPLPATFTPSTAKDYGADARSPSMVAQAQAKRSGDQANRSQPIWTSNLDLDFDVSTRLERIILKWTGGGCDFRTGLKGDPKAIKASIGQSLSVSTGPASVTAPTASSAPVLASGRYRPRWTARTWLPHSASSIRRSSRVSQLRGRLGAFQKVHNSDRRSTRWALAFENAIGRREAAIRGHGLCPGDGEPDTASQILAAAATTVLAPSQWPARKQALRPASSKAD